VHVRDAGAAQRARGCAKLLFASRAAVQRGGLHLPGQLSADNRQRVPSPRAALRPGVGGRRVRTSALARRCVRRSDLAQERARN